MDWREAGERGVKVWVRVVKVERRRRGRWRARMAAAGRGGWVRMKKCRISGVRRALKGGLRGLRARKGWR